MRPVDGKIQRVSLLIVLLAAGLGLAWFLASWAEQARGLSFGPVFTVVVLLQVVLGFGALLGATEEEQPVARPPAEQESTA